ncbi:MAG TPA: acetylxylan esterase [Rhizomicrobium sp.]|nr:acetylxylan esterase [Rhizomicrobium sp.]
MNIRLVLLLAAAAAASSASAADLTFTPLKASDIYAVGEPVGWTVGLQPWVATPPASSFTYTVKTNGGETVGNGEFDLSKGSAAIRLTLDHPAMVYLTVDRAAAAQVPQPTSAEATEIDAGLKAVLSKNDPGLKAVFDKYPDYCLIRQACAGESRNTAPAPDTRVATLGAAVAPGEIQPSAPRPADFDSFWAGQLALLKKVPVHPVLVPVATSVPGVRLYMFQLDSVGSHAHGYLAVPARKSKFPAMVVYQWAGVYALLPSICANRAAEGWLCVDVSSHDLPPDQATGVPSTYPEIGNSSRETSYFLDMYLRDTRALDWARTLREWNRKTLVITGTSMGGQQSLVTAGLNPGKYSAVVVNEPSGNDTNAALNGRMPAYPDWPVSDPKVAEASRYFDPVNFAPHINAPALVAVGFIDSVCPPSSVLSAFNQIRAPKELAPMPESDHNNLTPDKQAAFLTRSEEIFAVLLHGGRFVPNPSVIAGQ